MSKNEDVGQQDMGIGDAVQEIAQTTSQRIKAIYEMMSVDRVERRELADRVKHVAEEWDKAHEKQKIDGWKFLRNVASYITGEIDKRTK